MRIAVVLAGAWILAACEPSVGERLARAEQYFSDAEYRAAAIELKNALRRDEAEALARSL